MEVSGRQRIKCFVDYVGTDTNADKCKPEGVAVGVKVENMKKTVDHMHAVAAVYTTHGYHTASQHVGPSSHHL